MLGYYPQVISAIQEFKAITSSEGYVIDGVRDEFENVLDNAYLLTMNEDRILQWEKILNIKPLSNSTLDDRRDTIIAKIRGQGKLNTALINSIVGAFTGGTANSWVEDSVLYIEITPPPGNKNYQFSNIEKILSSKVPSHLGIHVSRNYSDWLDVIAKCPTWQDVSNSFDTWEDVYIFNPLTRGG
jgi:hypothetical protein